MDSLIYTRVPPPPKKKSEFRYFSFTTGSYRLEEPTKKLSIIDPNTAICKQFLVLHGNHNGEMGQKIDLVIIFDWRVLLTYKDQHVWTAFCKIFSGTPHLTIYGASEYASKYAYLAYLAEEEK